MGRISCGMTGSTLSPPFTNMSWMACGARNEYGSCVSTRPAKNSGR